MEILKFRAWTGQKMVHVRELNYDYSLGSMIANNCWIPEAIMQYTGFKDKNGTGKESFESDIVITREGISEIIFWSGSFWLIGIDWDGQILLSDRMCEFKIIGNKFENPEIINRDVEEEI